MPEPPIDPPSTSDDTPADQFEVCFAKLQELEKACDGLPLKLREGGLMWLSIQAVQNQLELLRNE